MRIIVLMAFVAIAFLHVSGQSEPPAGRQLGIAAFTSTPLILVNQTSPSFGHMYSNNRGLPFHGGASFFMKGKKRWGLNASVFHFPLRFQVNYQFISAPDPLVPEFSTYKLDFLGLSVMGAYTWYENETLQVYGSAGLDLLLRIAYSDETTYKDGSFRADGQKGAFNNALGAPSLKVGVRWSPREPFYFGFHSAVRYWGVELEEREYLDSRSLNFSYGLSIGVYI